MMKKRNLRLAVMTAAMALPTITLGGITYEVYGAEPVIYQSDLDSVIESYPGQNALGDQNTADPVYRSIKVVKRGVPAAKPVNTNDLPVRIDADKMYSNDTTGEVWGDGNVDVYQGLKEIHTDRIEGNMQTHEYHTVGPYHYLEDQGRLRDLKGEDLEYNTATGTMRMRNTKGYNDPFYIQGKNAYFEDGQGYIQHGWATTKSAMAFIHTPDYRVEGDDIDIYPGEKAVIHHARFYIKNTKVLSLPSYTMSLRSDRSQSIIFQLIPKPSYSSDDGFGLRAGATYPLGTNDELYMRYEWYTKTGFKPNIGVRHYLPWGVASFGYNTEEGELYGHKVWVKKRPELTVNTNTYHIADTKFTVRGGASVGHWAEENVEGSHWKYFGELSHDPLVLIPRTSLRFYLGYQRDYYGYNDFTRSMPYWGVNFNAAVTNKLNFWTGYRQNNIDRDSPYAFDTVETHKKVTVGGSYQLTRLDTLSVNTTRNIENGNLEDVDYTWMHDFHSFLTWLTYKTKDGDYNRDKTWELMVKFKDFDL